MNRSMDMPKCGEIIPKIGKIVFWANTRTPEWIKVKCGTKEPSTPNFTLTSASNWPYAARNWKLDEL